MIAAILVYMTVSSYYHQGKGTESLRQIRTSTKKHFSLLPWLPYISSTSRDKHLEDGLLHSTKSNHNHIMHFIFILDLILFHVAAIVTD